MGWTVLYLAFGVVALWLLGEVLLQYKARLRWRLVAFSGFLGVVIGVLLPSVPVIALGAVAFATGQTFVTLSFRRGFSTGWALGGKPGTSKRRRAGGGGSVQPMPPVPDASAAPPDEGPATAEFAAARPGAEDYPDASDYGDGIPPEPAGQPQPAADYADSYAPGGYQEPYPGAQDTGESYTYAGQYAAEPAGWGSPAESWRGGPSYPGTDQQEAQPYAQDYPAQQTGYGDEQGTAAWPAAGGGDPYYQETPPGGLWVPQQREPSVAAPEPGYGYPQEPQQDPSPGRDGYDSSGQGYYFTDDQRY
ncbi:hypothetical protein [Streptomyces sp. MP131-18]|uniref:hypothetical protein n=1 Tax=Streptomyces sp. MP131-18 TaxID=1857892 RepID=UPI00097C7207|nr:hypothetical protein [Streptomyces sp. MP131-18]ONK15010.1 hypothetical protein STBA_58230 [Streptomyces sp. MP131-18]